MRIIVKTLLDVCAATHIDRSVPTNQDWLALPSFAGDEIIILLGELNEDKTPSIEQTERVAEKIWEAMNEPHLLEIRAEDGSPDLMDQQCTARIGVAWFLRHEYTEDEVLKRADQAMHRAKVEGQDRICLRDVAT